MESGHRAFSMAFDLPTHLGLDSDHPLAEDEVGKLGVAIDTLKDMELVFEGLPMYYTVVFNTVGPAAIIIAMFVAAAEKQGVPQDKLSVVITNDILSVYLGRSTWIFAPEPSVRLVTDIVEYAVKNVPRFFPLNIQGVYTQAVGAYSAEAIGIAFAEAFAYLDSALARGLKIDEVAPRFSFFIFSSPKIFEEAAKYRAARRLWARFMKERYQAQDPRSLRFMVTGVSGASARIEAEMNLVRAAYGALACALGGVQTMWLQSYDEGYTIPTEKAARYSLRTMQILAEETDACDVIDPLGGSYYFESLTNLAEEEILGAVEMVEKMGGAVEAISTGALRKHLIQQDWERHKKLQTGEIPVVGVNKYRVEGEQEEKIEIFQGDPESARRQIERLNQIKADRDDGAVRKSLQEIREAAGTNRNLMPVLIEAVKNMCTVGEITSVLKEVFGEYQEPSLL